MRLKHGGGGGAGAFTAPLHFDLARDLLRLDAEAIARLTSNVLPLFDHPMWLSQSSSNFSAREMIYQPWVSFQPAKRVTFSSVG